MSHALAPARPRARTALRLSLAASSLIGLTLTTAGAWAGTTTVTVMPSDVPDETVPRVTLGDAPDGFGPDSWQGPASGKSNWHARYLADGDALSVLFPTQAATMRVSDLARIAYSTKRPTGTPAGRDWWIQIYTRPTGTNDARSWYHARYTNDYATHTATGAWTRYATDAGMTFGGQSFDAFVGVHGAELVEMISLHTDSGWGGFDGGLDGLEITLTDGSVGRVDFVAEGGKIQVAPWEVPDEEHPRVLVGDAAPGFGTDAWQGPASGKSNWHARYLKDGDALSALFPGEAPDLTIADLAAISYFTKRPDGTPAGRDWWLQIYTRPTGSGDVSSWYHAKFTNNYGTHATTGRWARYSTDEGMTFAGKTLAQLVTDFGDQQIEMISVQTNSSWNGFDGAVDGLEIRLVDGRVGRVDFAAQHDGVEYFFGVVSAPGLPGEAPTLHSVRCWREPDGHATCDNQNGVLILGPPICQ
ncbi:MAG: hypothetical protein CVU56_14510 [Deltaproteobacteria bacterium HGW-Deltaproteobacteria-14]|jgi:hypothetical protein|nr:MAG: hypothetical protein CVU56_14510 [Deltaproteobacteria bacterium HGW-Deltaproteobacteria-14]